MHPETRHRPDMQLGRNRRGVLRHSSRVEVQTQYARRGLSNNFVFGGINASLLLSSGAVACGGYGSSASFPVATAQYSKPVPLALPPCAQEVQLAMTDQRPDPSVIGQRYMQDTPGTRYPIQMQGDALVYVGNSLVLRLKQAGANAPNTSQATMSIELMQLFIDESIYYNSEYTAVTTLHIVLKNASSSQPCWQGQVSATATNYGKSANAVNYQETLDRLMDAAIAQLVKAPGFAEALCAKCTSPAAPVTR
jgi:hypothetical protein